MQKFRRGDIVTITAVVTGDHDGEAERILVKPESHYDTVFILRDKITLVTPFFNKEERVRKIHNPEITGTVAAMLDGYVWLRFDNGKLGTVPATELEVAA